MRVERIGLAECWLGDCREIAPTLPRPAAVISDPPYGQGYVPPGAAKAKTVNSGQAIIGGRFGSIEGDGEPFNPADLCDMAPIVLLWGAHRFWGRLPADTGRWLFWDKRCGVVGPNDQGCGEMAWTSAPGPVRVIRHLWNGLTVQSGSVEAQRQAGSSAQVQRVHPTQKPVAVMHWAIEQARVPTGGTILDPYMGSGSTGVAAVQMGHPFVGIEIDERYFETACRRIEAAQRQADLFVAPAKPRPVDPYPVLPLGDAQ